jgi:hypothetical protein
MTDRSFNNDLANLFSGNQKKQVCLTFKAFPGKIGLTKSERYPFENVQSME